MLAKAEEEEEEEEKRRRKVYDLFWFLPNIYTMPDSKNGIYKQHYIYSPRI